LRRYRVHSGTFPNDCKQIDAQQFWRLIALTKALFYVHSNIVDSLEDPYYSSIVSMRRADTFSARGGTHEQLLEPNGYSKPLGGGISPAQRGAEGFTITNHLTHWCFYKSQLHLLALNC
jgi:hypothetical protein